MNAAGSKNEDAVKNLPERTGFQAREIDHDVAAGPEPERPMRMAWMSDDLLAETQQVWSRAYGRAVCVEEAAEILMNVKRMAETLMKAKRGGASE